MENLNIRGMLKNHALAKGTADSGWGMLIGFCRYKAPWRDGMVEQIDRFYPSTKTCHVCGHKNDALTLADRSWICPHCGTLHDRDVNAAKVILAAAVGPATPARPPHLPPERRNVKPAETLSDTPALAGVQASMKREARAL